MTRQDPRLALLRKAANDSQEWDVIVIGGGASGLSTAWDAVSRGLKVALLEQYDFAKSTSSKSTKLVHGGVRYLQNMELGLVREALRERQLLLENASEFCSQLDFILPSKSWFGRWYYRIGLGLYDFLGKVGKGRGGFHFPRSRMLSKSEVLDCLPNFQSAKLSGGVCYSDAQFDDAGMAVALAQVINSDAHSVALNYAKVSKINHLDEDEKALVVSDSETGESWTMRTKVVINATGVFTDVFRESQGIEKQWQVQMSRGAHIVCSGSLLGNSKALIVPKTSDGRVLFAVPWMGHTIIGTTDVATDTAVSDPVPSAEELEFLLRESGQALGVKSEQVLSQWAGLRPLVSKAGKSTKSLSRKHVVEVSKDGIISLLGGKWTTARAMGEDTMNIAIQHHGLKPSESVTATRKLIDFGAMAPLSSRPIDQLEKIVHEAVSDYYARTVEDVLSRRMRTLMLDAESTKQHAQTVVRVMADLLSWSQRRQDQELAAFRKITDQYHNGCTD